MLNTLKRFAVKNLIPMSQFTDSEKSKLARVFLDEQIARHFHWKRYPINDQVQFEGEAQIISWENFKISTGTLEEAKELAEKEKLDLVLVRRNDPVVRIMNYKNWILKWAFRDKQLRTNVFKKKTAPLYQVSHRINESDLMLKFKKIGEMLDKYDSVNMEARVNNENSLDEVRSLRKFELTVQNKIKGSIEGKNVIVKVHSADFYTKINIRKVGKHTTYSEYNLALNEPIDEQFRFQDLNEVNFGNEEDEYMKEILSGGNKRFETAKTEVLEELEAKVTQEENNNMEYYEDTTDPIKEELNSIRQKVAELVGDDLADKFLKGRLKYK